MKSKIINLRVVSFLFVIALIMLVNVTFADPSSPPPPPKVTSYTYYLVDRFISCGPEYERVVKYCDDYYLRRKIVTQSGKILSQSDTNVCGKDSRCTVGKPCTISYPYDNRDWKTKYLSNSWYCPMGYELAKMHTPGTLDPGFKTVSFSEYPPYIDNISIDLYFNAYIPACVNRIPMINFKPELIDSNGKIASVKTGLYVKHQTLSYDASPLGGVLENFKIPGQDYFRKTYNLKAQMYSYRMWSFRQRFVEGLQRVVQAKNLQIPGNVNVDSLSPDKPHDLGSLYLSKDFMMGAYRVRNVNSRPVGQDITMSLNSKCNFDVDDLSLPYIKRASDLKTALEDPNKKKQIIDILNNKKYICKLDKDVTITNVNYLKKITQYERNYYSKTFKINISKLKNYDFDNTSEFKEWALDDWDIYDVEDLLRSLDYLSSSNPEEDLQDVKAVFTYTKNVVEIINVTKLDMSGIDNASDFINYLNNSLDIGELNYYMKEAGYVTGKKALLKVFLWNNISNDSVKMSFEILNDNVSLYADIVSTTSYNKVASVNLSLNYVTSTENSWNWRSLQSLTLTQLAKCLYNWNSCMFNPRRESGTSWTMNEVADLGYGPALNSIAYQWAQKSLQKEDGITYTSHFDGARGYNVINTRITVYKGCYTNEKWLSKDRIYACYNGTVYKCYYGLSNDYHPDIVVKQANLGNTIDFGNGKGYVCINDSNYGPIWRKVDCNNVG